MQLDAAAGKNSGTVDGINYFRCKPLHGLFVRPAACRLLAKGTTAGTPRRSATASTPRTGSAKRRSAAPAAPAAPFAVGAKVFVSSRGLCTVRHIGPLEGVAGTFIGVELPTATGKNDGSVEGVRYFRTAPSRGLFVRPSKCTYNGVAVESLL